MFSLRRAIRLIVQLAWLGAVPFAAAADLRISLPVLPPLVESADKGQLALLAKAIAREWKGGKVTIMGPTAFALSVENVATGRANLHMPMIRSPARDEDDLPYRYSTITLFDVYFVLYTRKDSKLLKTKDVSIAALTNLNIETDRAHANLFDFPVRETDSIDVGLANVNSGRTDGFLFAMIETDAALKRLGYTNIARIPYRRFAVKMLLPKGPAGDALDDSLSRVIMGLKASGEYRTIMGPLLTQKFEP